MSDTITIQQSEAQELLAHLKVIVQTLENAGMVDTARDVRLEAQQLVVGQLQWEG